jgi:hypothetical protein
MFVVGDELDTCDLAVTSDELEHDTQGSARHPHGAGAPVHDCGARTGGAAREPRRDSFRSEPLLGSEPDRCLVRAQNHVRVEDLQETPEVRATCGAEEGIDQFRVGDPIRRAIGAPSLHPSTGAAGQLASSRRCPTENRCDLVERDCEHVVQDECHPLGRGKQLQHDQHGGADRIGQDRLLFGVQDMSWRRGRLGQRRIERQLGS